MALLGGMHPRRHPSLEKMFDHTSPSMPPPTHHTVQERASMNQVKDESRAHPHASAAERDNDKSNHMRPTLKLFSLCPHLESFFFPEVLLAPSHSHSLTSMGDDLRCDSHPSRFLSNPHSIQPSGPMMLLLMLMSSCCLCVDSECWV